MTDFASTATTAFALVASSGATAAIVGGFAVSVRTEPRFTRDLDLAVAVASDGEAERLLTAFHRNGHLTFQEIEHEPTGRLATARVRLATGDIVDLLFASSGIESEVVAAADHLEVLTGLILPVARTGHLLALKLLARDDDRRPQDLVDLRALRAAATAADLRDALEAVALITARGFQRGRDLDLAFRELQPPTEA